MINLNQQIQQFLDFCKSRKTLNDKTIKAYKIDLRQFSEFTSNTYSKEGYRDNRFWVHETGDEELNL